MNTGGVEVRLYTEAQVLTGFICVPEGQRLSDLLNGTIVGQPDNSKGNFIELSDVTISYTDGTKERPETAHINKANIQMVMVLDGNSCRGLGAQVGAKPYPFVQKSPVRTRMQVHGYELSGTVHCANQQKVQHLLGEKLTFMPVTDARIRGISSGLWWSAPFVVVNKEQLVLLQHEEIALGS